MNRSDLEAELRGALEEEIAYLEQSGAERTVAATGGRRSNVVGPWVLYNFLLERDFLAPDATPVVAQIGKDQFNAQIVGIRGTEITLGLPSDLGPVIARVEISVDSTAILKRILSRLNDQMLASLPDGLARIAFGYETPQIGEVDVISQIKISEEQVEALKKAVGGQLQFIWGPPGTGKTRALAALCEVLVESGESVLLTSHTNVAVDEALLRVAGPGSAGQEKGPLHGTPAYVSGKLLRLGVPKHADFAQVEELLAEAITRRLTVGLNSRLSEIDGELGQIDADLWPLKILRDGKLPEGVLEGTAREISNRLAEILGERDEINARYGDLNSLLAAWKKADAFAAEVRSQERAHAGAAASLDRRRKEHEAAERAAAQASERLYEVLNPKGLRRVFKRDPGPPRLALRDSERTLRLAATSLASATGRELEARHLLEADRSKESELKPAVPKDEALRLVAERDSQLHELRRRELVLSEEAGRALGELNARRMELTRERRQVGEEIKEITESVVRDAQLIGTTLTKAATDSALSGRHFDTVIIDEVSMAPLPLVYLAALLALKRVVLVGDFRQLPPIVQSPGPLAQKWLGRDAFCQVGIDSTDLPEGKRGLRSNLWIQHRMAPEIRKFASDSFYNQKLTDYFSEVRPEDRWWAEHPPAGSAVCLVDTTSLGAWSQRSPGARPSKFNIYSAVVATELAELLLLNSDGQGPSGSPRIGIITPYRAQANLLKTLLEERGLTDAVHPGTVHSFQGTESDVIIFDFVEEEPNWKAGPLLLAQGDRLMNVAVTRAKHRLFVLGSYSHVQRQLKRSRLWDLVRYAHDLQRIDAQEFLRSDLHRAVAAATARISFGTVSDLDGADHLRVLSEQDFFGVLDRDMQTARQRVVLFSPFLGRRADDLMPRIKVCVDAGVEVYVVTRPLADVEGGLRSFYAKTHDRLEQVGARLVFFREMHHKLVFVDDHVLYVGGLNPLSHRHTAEVMDRWDSRAVTKAHAEQVRLDELILMWSDPDDLAMRTCPRDGSPLLIVAPVTYQKYDPVYWGCTSWPECDFKRRFSTGPRRSAGRVCDKCGTAMRLEEKAAGLWWTCGKCRARRKVQEGEASDVQLSLAPNPSSRKTKKPRR